MLDKKRTHVHEMAKWKWTNADAPTSRQHLHVGAKLVSLEKQAESHGATLRPVEK